LLTFVGGLGAYYWAKEFVAPRYALLAGVLFILSPYHINELFQASLLAEYAAVSVLLLHSLLPNESVAEVEDEI